MEHQDFNMIVFTRKDITNKNEAEKKISQKEVKTNSEETVIIESDKKLGQMLSQARLAKGLSKQSECVTELNNKCKLNISVQLYSKWEANKETPTNEQIAKIERVLGVKLPRNKKIKVEE